MPQKLIKKSLSSTTAPPNLENYEACQAAFSWEDARTYLDGLPCGGLNIAHEAVSRHASSQRKHHVAIRWIDKDGQAHDYSYASLNMLSNQFANVLHNLGVRKDERVFVLLPRIPALYITALGTLKNGNVFSPLFSAFGPEPIKMRMEIGAAKVLVTTATLYQRKVKQLRASLPSLTHILIVNEDGGISNQADTYDFYQLLNAANEQFSIPRTAPEDMALLHFTSGTTGKPKGAVHVHNAVIMHNLTARLALDLHPEDIFWCTADPGWVTGTSYGIIGPLTVGATMIVDYQEFDTKRWYSILQDQKVSVWYTAPTAVRMLMKTGKEIVDQYDTSYLRLMASVGEPLNPEAVLWGQAAFGLPFHDNWWQSETGGIMISNYAAMDIKPGSMGRPIPGVEAAIVKRLEKGGIEIITEPNVPGELALKKGWPSMFRGYLGEEARYQQCFIDDWYLTDDLACCDKDGYFWFIGRADDLIKSAGHLIGPFEVESALMEHPAVAEAAVIGIPDPIAKEVVKAFIVLKPEYTPDVTLQKQLLGHARKKLGAAVAPREITFKKNLPKTRSGKIMRRLLKARELGLPEGDTSTLENSE